MPLPGWEYVAGLALAAELSLSLTTKPAMCGAIRTIRIAFLGLGVLGTLLMAVIPQVSGGWSSSLVFLIALVAEAMGRWQFYAERVPFPLRPN